MLKTLKRRVWTLLNRLCPSWACKLEYQHQKFNRFGERPVEFAFVFRKIAEIYPKQLLDVGTGNSALPHLIRSCGILVTAIDNIRDYWPGGMFNRHYYVLHDDITDTRLRDKFDMITCISAIEHIERADAAVRNMFSLLNPGGHLVLTFPYTEKGYVRNVYELPGSNYGQEYPFITQSYSRLELDRWLKHNHGVIMEQEYWQFWDGDYWTVGSQIIPPKKVAADDRHQLTCLDITKG
jgi:SAM-dependent methyltransferase